MCPQSSSHPWCLSDSCDVRCARKKTEKRFRKTIRTLRKTVSRDQFRVRLSGTEHEVARKAPRPSEPQQSCGGGQLHPGGRCGELGGNWEQNSSSMLGSGPVSSEGSWFTLSAERRAVHAEVGGAVRAAEIPSVDLLLAIDVLQSRTRAHSPALQLRYSLQYA